MTSPTGTSPQYSSHLEIIAGSHEAVRVVVCVDPAGEPIAIRIVDTGDSSKPAIGDLVTVFLFPECRAKHIRAKNFARGPTTVSDHLKKNTHTKGRTAGRMKDSFQESERNKLDFLFPTTQMCGYYHREGKKLPLVSVKETAFHHGKLHR